MAKLYKAFFGEVLLSSVSVDGDDFFSSENPHPNTWSYTVKVSDIE